MAPKIFISHSHQDRHIATDLQVILEKYGAEIYLDQERIRAGDILPDKIKEGIAWCDTFLLIWSTSTSSSEWVEREWSMAYELRKKIVPYVLDSMPLPPGLNNLVYIGAKDRELGNAQLLTIVFGEQFTPDSRTLFPGQWQALVDVYGMGQGTYNLELRANGQVEGDGGVNQSGLLGQLGAQIGITEFLKMRYPLHGSWSYDQAMQLLTLDITMMASGFGQQSHDTVRIQTTGYEKGAIIGKDLVGRVWTLQRVK